MQTLRTPNVGLLLADSTDDAVMRSREWDPGAERSTSAENQTDPLPGFDTN
jgi:hypothetical protein